MREPAAALLATVMLIGCAAGPDPQADLFSALRGLAQARTDPGLRQPVNDYLSFLDSLRARNVRLAQSEQEKYNWMTGVALSLGTGSAIGGFVIENDEASSKVAGVLGALAALATALVAKYQHAEDAERSRVCVSVLDGLLIGFEAPVDTAGFRTMRDEQRSLLGRAGCLGPDTR
jgi:hypothetical protein